MKKKIGFLLFLLKPYWKYGKLFMAVMLVTSLAVKPLSTYLTTLLPQKAIDTMIGGGTKKEVLSVILSFTVVLVVLALIQKLSEVYMRLAQQKISFLVENDVNVKSLYTDFKYYDSPDFYTKFIFAQEKYPGESYYAAYLLPKLLSAAVTAGTLSAYIASAGPGLLAVSLGFVLLYTLVGLPKIKPETELQMEITQNRKPVSYAERLFKQRENAAEVRSSRAGVKFTESVKGVVQNYRKVVIKYIKRVFLFDTAESLLSPLQTAVVLGFILLFVIKGDVAKIGLYASLTLASTTIISNLKSLFQTVQEFYRLTLYGEKISEFFNAESVIEPLSEGGAKPDEGLFDVELRDVSFRYENAEPLFEHFNLKIERGRRIAIVGENGAGKSTLLKLLIRLNDVSDGAVLINGRDIRDYDVHALRMKIGVAFQDVRILAMSLRDTLTVYGDAPDEKLVQAMETLGLEQVLERVGGNLDTMVSREFTENGVVLSGGEAQRLALARLLVGKFGLLILDEPSAALDPLAEAKLMETIDKMAENATTLMIAHRLSTVRDFDVIHYVEHGKIVESGSHDSLMALQGKYHTMFTTQAKKYRSDEA